jgi:hypothetical protein
MRICSKPPVTALSPDELGLPGAVVNDDRRTDALVAPDVPGGAMAFPLRLYRARRILSSGRFLSCRSQKATACAMSGCNFRWARWTFRLKMA